MSSLPELNSNGNQPENTDVKNCSSLAGRLVVVCLICITLGVAFHFIAANWVIWSAVKVVSVSLTILIVPGVLLILIVKLKSPLTILELGGLGAALSIGTVTLLTILCMLTHTSFLFAVLALIIGSFFLVAVAIRQNATVGLTTITAAKPEWLFFAGLVVIGFLLYLHGSPLAPGEDQIHIAVARRLAILQHPSIYNIYLTPDLVYSYPFPVTHVVYALTSILSGLDVLFVYHKMRFVWAMLAILCVYLATKKIFDNSKLAYVSGWTSIVLVANGIFGEVSPLMWAQLVPFSHASDVAMGVLLPLLLVSTFWYLGSENKRDGFIFLVISLLMCLALINAKIREIVQFLVYSSSFLAVIFFTKQHRSLMPKMAVLGGLTLLIAGLYIMYHRATVPSVTSIVEFDRMQILKLWKNKSIFEYIAQPFNDGLFVNNFHLFFNNINAIVLLCSPLVFLAFLRNRLVFFIWAGLFAYLMIIRFPIISVPYLTLTYFDMLSTPVRNVIFFIFIMTGALVYITAIFFSKLKSLVLAIILLIGFAFVLFASTELMRNILISQSDGLFLPLLIALPVSLGLSFTRWGKSFSSLWVESEFSGRSVVCVVVFIISLGFFFFKPDVSLATWRNPGATNLEQSIGLALAPSGQAEYVVLSSAKIYKAKGISDVPPPDLIQWMKQNVPVDVVCAVNMFNGNILTTFVPQRVPAWPLLWYDPVNYCRNFPRFCKAADITFEQHGTQPFFNEDEQLEDRINYLNKLGITYVVVDPAYYDMMGRVLGQYPDIFLKEFDKGYWSVFKIKLP